MVEVVPRDLLMDQPLRLTVNRLFVAIMIHERHLEGEVSPRTKMLL